MRPWLTALALAALAAPAGAAGLDDVLQPGDGLGAVFPAKCTFGFLLLDATGRAHALTAAHCVTHDEVVASLGLGEVGRVVHVDAASDFALVRLRAGVPWDARVPEVGGPTGATTPADTDLGDLLGTYGHGLVVGATGPTRARPGVFVGEYPDGRAFWWNTVATPGDSGAPVVHRETGKAVGLVATTGLVGHQSTDTGPTVSHALARLAAAGFQVRLAVEGEASP